MWWQQAWKGHETAQLDSVTLFGGQISFGESGKPQLRKLRRACGLKVRFYFIFLGIGPNIWNSISLELHFHACMHK